MRAATTEGKVIRRLGKGKREGTEKTAGQKAERGEMWRIRPFFPLFSRLGSVHLLLTLWGSSFVI